MNNNPSQGTITTEYNWVQLMLIQNLLYTEEGAINQGECNFLGVIVIGK